MSLGVALKIARREIRGGARDLRVFLVCLALGIAAIAAIGSVRESIQQGLAQEGASLLGGDAEIQLTYRFASDAERDWMETQATAVSEVVNFRSMAVVGEGEDALRGLTQVKGVDGAYPLMGSILLEPVMDLGTALAGAGGLPGGIMEAVLADRLLLNVGDEFSLGSQRFVLTALLLREPDGANGGFALGPRTLVQTSHLANSDLLRAGTLFESAYRLALPAIENLDDLRAEAESAVSSGGFRWRDRRNGAPSLTRFVERLAMFLVLVGLAGLIVGGVGISSSVRAYLEEKIPVIAMLKSLGASQKTVLQVYFLQIVAFTILGVAIGLAFGAALPLMLAPLIEAQLPVHAEVRIYPVPLAQAAIYGFLTALLFSLWPLARAARIRPAALFRVSHIGATGWPGWGALLTSAGSLLALLTAAVIFSGQLRLVLWVAVGLVLSMVALAGAAYLVKWIAQLAASRSWVRRRVPLHLALRAIAGPGSEVASVVLSLGLGLTVLAAIGQIDANLRGAIVNELPDRAPSFFVIDLQKDQMPEYLAELSGDPQVSRVENAPMLRGIITKINARPAEEVAGDHWVISGDRGITYSADPPKDAKLAAGQWWPKDYDGPPQISFAHEEATEIGLELGDTLTVNVLGRDITATITSFRDVDFSNAGMGFVMSMNPAAISAAPHSFISTIYADADGEAKIMRELTTKFPNVTAISVRDAVERIGGVMKSIAAAITYSALATLATGLVVLIGAAAVSERSRAFESAVLKTLGATRSVILISGVLRSMVLGLSAGIVAVFAGTMAAWAVMIFVMDAEFRLEPISALIVTGAGIFLTVAAGALFSVRAFRVRPAGVLRSRE